MAVAALPNRAINRRQVAGPTPSLRARRNRATRSSGVNVAGANIMPPEYGNPAALQSMMD
jgi:hypothetical protein